MGNFESCIKENNEENYYSVFTDPSTQNSTETSCMPSPLKNIGANCYLNSVLQAISSSNEFVDDIIKLKQNYESLEKLRFFTDLIQNIHQGNQKLRDISKNKIFKNWNKSGQQDSFELLSYVLNQVFNEIREYKECHNLIEKRNIIQWLKEFIPMRIIISYTIQCECGNKVDVPLHSELALHIPILLGRKEPIELQYLVDEFFSDDIIENYECYLTNCVKQSAIRKTKLVKPLPNTICLHLQRTYWNGKRMKKIKILVNFNETLIIKSEFCKLNGTIKSDQLVKKDVESSLDGSLQSKQNDFCPIDEEYRLTSFIVHRGSVKGGHYVCYKSMNKRWFLTNDSQVKEVERTSLFKCQAYLLFFEKVKQDTSK